MGCTSGASWARTPERMPSPPEQIALCDIAYCETHAHAPAFAMFDARERVPEMVVGRVDGEPQQPLQAIPGGEDLRQRPLSDDAACAIDSDTLCYFDAELAR